MLPDQTSSLLGCDMELLLCRLGKCMCKGSLLCNVFSQEYVSLACHVSCCSSGVTDEKQSSENGSNMGPLKLLNDFLAEAQAAWQSHDVM